MFVSEPGPQLLFDRNGHFVSAEVRLKDGTPVTIRPPTPDDRSRLEAMFRACSSETLYTRFLSPGLGIPLRYLDRLLTHRPPQILALLAVLNQNHQKKVVGLMNFVELDHRGRGEIAIIIQDEYQNLGLGHGMLRCLYQLARAQGVTNFSADIEAGNRRVFHLIQKSGLPCKLTIDQGVAHAELEITSPRSPQK